MCSKLERWMESVTKLMNRCTSIREHDDVPKQLSINLPKKSGLGPVYRANKQVFFNITVNE